MFPQELIHDSDSRTTDTYVPNRPYAIDAEGKDRSSANKISNKDRGLPTPGFTGRKATTADGLPAWPLPLKKVSPVPLSDLYHRAKMQENISRNELRKGSAFQNENVRKQNGIIDIYRIHVDGKPWKSQKVRRGRIHENGHIKPIIGQDYILRTSWYVLEDESGFHTVVSEQWLLLPRPPRVSEDVFEMLKRVETVKSIGSGIDLLESNPIMAELAPETDGLLGAGLLKWPNPSGYVPKNLRSKVPKIQNKPMVNYWQFRHSVEELVINMTPASRKKEVQKLLKKHGFNRLYNEFLEELNNEPKLKRLVKDNLLEIPLDAFLRFKSGNSSRPFGIWYRNHFKTREINASMGELMSMNGVEYIAKTKLGAKKIEVLITPFDMNPFKSGTDAMAILRGGKRDGMILWLDNKAYSKEIKDVSAFIKNARKNLQKDKEQLIKILELYKKGEIPKETIIQYDLLTQQDFQKVIGRLDLARNRLIELEKKYYRKGSEMSWTDFQKNFSLELEKLNIKRVVTNALSEKGVDISNDLKKMRIELWDMSG